MHIGIAGPVTLQMLRKHLDNDTLLPPSYGFAPMANWVDALLERGHRVSLFTLSPGIDEPIRLAGERITIHVGRYRAKGRARDLFALERQDLSEAMRREVCEVLHAHWTYEFALAALDSGKPTVITAHDAPLNILRLHPHPYRVARVLMSLQVISRAQCLTAVSPYVAVHLKRFFFPKVKIHVVPNGVASNLFCMARRRSGETKPLTFATVLTGWAGRKNGHAAIAAFHRFRASHPGAKLLMFGDGHGANEAAAQWAAEQGMQDGIEFIGATDHSGMLQTLSSRVDVLVHPSLEESFGMAVAEAMALGIPVIGGRQSGAVPYLLEQGEVGLLTDVASPAAIATSMEMLADDAPLRERLSTAARHSSKSRFDMRRALSRFEEIYVETCSRQRACLPNK